MKQRRVDLHSKKSSSEVKIRDIFQDYRFHNCDSNVVVLCDTQETDVRIPMWVKKEHHV